ncbi:hypothetical protein [Maribacter halichondriae]|uniref:hypothetical protein n=1 Tax=Maribacter halichondriae TaxID=2980554 RepID=UPI0023595C24|nr:hypothetical protein [Maribacter sp. Hal144]
MKKASVLLGTGVLALLLLSFAGKDRCEKSKENHEAKIALNGLQQPFADEALLSLNTEPLSLNEITVIEFEEEIDLGFDTAEYLPEGFNPYEGMVLNIDDIELVEFEEEIDLGFDTADYLPKGFNAYAGMDLDFEEVFSDLDLDDILYFIEEEEIDLGFDTSKYLPEGFDPYAK